MDAADVTTFIAQAEAARGLRPITDIDGELNDLRERGLALPWLSVGRDPISGELRATPGDPKDYRGHDNEGRMQAVCDFLTRRALPMVDPEAAGEVTGAYRVELHDSHCYLDSRPMRAYSNALVFSRPRAAADRVSLLPDPYQMGGYGGLLDKVRACDRKGWDDKGGDVMFAGSTTGDRDPRRNARIAACVWALGRPHMRLKITGVVQMGVQDALSAVPRLAEAMAPPVELAEHFQHRYLLNIAGNTACWSRVPMVLSSRSLLLDMWHPDMTWYSAALRDGDQCVAVRTLDDLEATRQACEADPVGCQARVHSANRFAAEFLTAERAASYTAQLMEHAGSLRRA